MKIRQHIPDFISGVDPQVGMFSDLRELLAIDWIQRWREEPGFYRFSLSSDETRDVLMCEVEDGKTWWVVGFFGEHLPKDFGLPQWSRRKSLSP